jgi:hypothetical protein
MVIYEYETRLGAVRAFYQTLTTNSSNGYFKAALRPVQESRLARCAALFQPVLIGQLIQGPGRC